MPNGRQVRFGDVERRRVESHIEQMTLDDVLRRLERLSPAYLEAIDALARDCLLRNWPSLRGHLAKR